MTIIPQNNHFIRLKFLIIFKKNYEKKNLKNFNCEIPKNNKTKQ